MKSGASFALPGRALAVLLAVLLMTATLLAGPTSAQAQQSGAGSLPVSGTLADGGTFEGTISDLDASANRAGDLVISGVLDGTATNASGETTRVTDQAFTTSSSSTSARSSSTSWACRSTCRR